MIISPSRVRLPLAISGISILLLSGCAPAEPNQTVSGANGFGHVHGLDVEPASKTVYAATHNGVWKLPPIGSPTIAENDLDGPIAGRAQDTMGFTMTDSQMLASGHPDPREHPDLKPANLGLIESYDEAVTWDSISLWEVTDFHDISAVRQPTAALHVYGYDASSGTVSFSKDSGRTTMRSRRTIRRQRRPSTDGTSPSRSKRTMIPQLIPGVH
ncbi:MAG: hypothetical protein JWP30_1841 [Homoserinimonas sp.]|jgi:hypothetical protein|nr:hypothetical protein [Homoserinimonas sp.]